MVRLLKPLESERVPEMPQNTTCSSGFRRPVNQVTWWTPSGRPGTVIAELSVGHAGVGEEPLIDTVAEQSLMLGTRRVKAVAEWWLSDITCIGRVVGERERGREEVENARWLTWDVERDGRIARGGEMEGIIVSVWLKGVSRDPSWWGRGVREEWWAAMAMLVVSASWPSRYSNTWFLRQTTMAKRWRRRKRSKCVGGFTTYLSGMKNWLLEVDEAEEEDWARRWWWGRLVGWLMVATRTWTWLG
jgi:hypothetical protein